MTLLFKCPKPLPHDLNLELQKLAVYWAKHPDRPRLNYKIALHWDNVIAEWSEDITLPLFIRKSQRGVARGEVLIHDTGRPLILTDNSPANWSYITAFDKGVPSLSDIKSALEKDCIPVAMVVDREMKARSRYKCCRVAIPSPNEFGWKVCHKKGIGLQGRTSVTVRPIQTLKDHFRSFLSPLNLFLVPQSLGGLGEIEHIIHAISNEPFGL